MADPKYEYQKVNAVKVVVQSKQSGKVLLIQEPETNEWMPLHWGLPGGKPLVKESLLSAFDRKMEEELGTKFEPEGILAIEELLIEERTVHMYIFLASVDSEDAIKRDNKNKWIGKEELEGMSEEVFTEFYNKRLLLDFFEGSLKLIPTSIIRTENYFELATDPHYKEWLDSGTSPEKR